MLCSRSSRVVWNRPNPSTIGPAPPQISSDAQRQSRITPAFGRGPLAASPGRHGWLSVLSRKLLAHDFAHELLSNRLVGQPEIGLQCIVDEGLVTLSCLLGLALEAPQNRVVKVDGYTCLPRRGDYGT